MLSGKHLIAGDWTPGSGSFDAIAPATGTRLAPSFAEGSAALVDRAAVAAEAAFPDYAGRSRSERARFLRAIAEAIEERGDLLTARGSDETALPEARLNGERGRTVGQLRMFADWIEDGSYLGARVDRALPERQPLPRPDMRLTRIPLGPVAVFGASNFPLAFSVAGGDTASALAAGCPVIFKGHPAHPGTSELVAAAIAEAVAATGMPAGTFSLIHGAGHEVGSALVQHPLVRAVGFTGSLRGGRALFDLAAARPDPIPFYGELGSINPVFALPAALAARGPAMATAWVGSLTLGVGQFCTNPGVVVALDGSDLDGFISVATGAVDAIGEQPMLTPGIAEAYRCALADRDSDTLKAGGGPAEAPGNALPAIHRVSGARWLADESLWQEVFGPAGIVVGCKDEAEIITVARRIEGQLTVTLQMDEADLPLAGRLVPIVVRKAGRLIRNGFPTGVEVCHAMMHGGPYPASTDARATSVGTLAIGRFLRPVAFQDFPGALLPRELRDDGEHPRRLDNGGWRNSE
jgi:NADP-dependent aldehyde dehydrogenase